MTPAEKAQSIRDAIGLFDHVCTDGNYGEYHSFVSHMYLFLSLYLWLDGRQDDAFGALDQALAQYRLFEKVCREKNGAYTAPLVQLVKVDLAGYQMPDPADPTTTAAALPEDWPWWNVPEAEEVKQEMQADPRWEAWVVKCGQGT